jgi:hypothetical protein
MAGAAKSRQAGVPVYCGQLTGIYGLDPSHVLLQVLIQKGFKSNILELLIPESLLARFWKCGL